LVPRQYDWKQTNRVDEMQEMSQYLLISNKVFEIPTIIEAEEIVCDEPDLETILLFVGLLFQSVCFLVLYLILLDLGHSFLTLASIGSLLASVFQTHGRKERQR